MKIIVNAREYDWKLETISYEDICKLADKKGTPACTWTIRNSDGSRLGGQLFPTNLDHPNHSIPVVGGMIINCANTNRA